MTVIFYTMTQDEKTISKNLTGAAQSAPINLTLKDSTNILNPVFILQNPATITGYNYAYIEDMDRYYFVNSPEIDTQNICTVSMRVDVLMSFKTDILNMTVIAERSTNNYNRYLVDNIIPSQNTCTVQTKQLTSGLFASNLLATTDYCYALTVNNRRGEQTSITPTTEGGNTNNGRLYI